MLVQDPMAQDAGDFVDICIDKVSVPIGNIKYVMICYAFKQFLMVSGCSKAPRSSDISSASAVQ